MRPFAFQNSSMVEHAAVNRVVVGSSPTSGANFAVFPDSALKIKCAISLRSCSMVESRRVGINRVVVGSSPTSLPYSLAANTGKPHQ